MKVQQEKLENQESGKSGKAGKQESRKVGKRESGKAGKRESRQKYRKIGIAGKQAGIQESGEALFMNYFS